MSFRSPTPDGLAVGPNAPGNVNNPAALAVELQVHHFWGRYNLITQLPNVGTVDGVAVVGANAASAPAYAKMAPGDLAFAQATNRLYVLIDRGTLAGNDAVWESTNATSTVVQTVRDAHVIVVGQAGHLTALAAVAIPPLAANSLNLGATGEQLNITVDYLDTGDGTQLRNALAAALASGVQIDIRLRPCNIVVTPAVIGADNWAFRVPPGCRLIGAGGNPFGVSLLTGTDGTGGSSQAVIRLDSNAELESVGISSPGAVAAPGGAGILGVIDQGPVAHIHRVSVTVENGAVARVQTAAIWGSAVGAAALVNDFVLEVDDMSSNAQLSYGIRWAAAAFAINPNNENEIRDGIIRAGCPIGVEILNMEGVLVHNVQHLDAISPVSSFAWSVNNGVFVANQTYRGPRFVDCRTLASTDETIGVNQTGCLIAIGAIAPGATVRFGPAQIRGYQCRFNSALVPVAIRKDAILVVTSATDVSQLVDITISDCEAQGQRRGIVIDGSGAAVAGIIRSARISNCIMRDSLFVAGVQSGNGLHVRGNIAFGAGQANVFNVGAINCDFSGANGAVAGAIGTYIEDIRCVNTMIGFCQTQPGLNGVGLTDNGLSSEIAHNLV